MCLGCAGVNSIGTAWPAERVSWQWFERESGDRRPKDRRTLMEGERKARRGSQSSGADMLRTYVEM
jgi:hypothetical protein